MSNTMTAPVAEIETEVSRKPIDSPTRAALRRLARNRTAMASVGFLILLALSAIAAPILAPYDPLSLTPADALKAPSVSHLLGTDNVGRDVLSRMIFGGRTSLVVAVVSVAFAATFGIVLGLVSGYFGGYVDAIVMRLMDMMLAFPGLLLALVIVAFLGSGLQNVIMAVGVSTIPNFARLVRGSVLSARENLYVEAARCIGCRDSRIMFIHILPNVATPVTVLASLAFGWSILTAASLSFLGLGVQPPTPEWGVMLSEGREYLTEAPWATVFPGMAIMLTVLSANLLGDGLRDALDPHQRA